MTNISRVVNKSTVMQTRFVSDIEDESLLGGGVRSFYKPYVFNIYIYA